MGKALRNPPHVVVGFCGRSGSGKTTVAKAVKERFMLPSRSGRPCYVEKFARPIREMLRVVGVEKGDEPGETPHPLFRSAAQGLGQLMRRLDDFFWVDALDHVVRNKSAPSVVLIDDLRFPNEASICDLIVALHTTRDNGLTAEQMRDTSETAWEAIPCWKTFANDSREDVNHIADAVFEKVQIMFNGDEVSV